MIVDKRDQVCAKILLEILNKAELPLKGHEIVTAGRVYEWSATLLKRIESDLAPQPVVSNLEESSPIKLEEPVKSKKCKKDKNV